MEIFSKANRLLIDSDLDKKRRGKRTNRYRITPIFIRWTESLETICRCFDTLKVQTIQDIKNKNGNDLPQGQRVTDPTYMRTFKEHFQYGRELELGTWVDP